MCLRVLASSTVHLVGAKYTGDTSNISIFIGLDKPCNYLGIIIAIVTICKLLNKKQSKKMDSIKSSQPSKT